MKEQSNKQVEKGKLSLTFRLFNKLGLINDSERYGRITIIGLMWLSAVTVYRKIIFNYAYKAYIFEPLYKKRLRPAIWRGLGCEVGRNVHIGHQVRLDFGNSNRIHIGDDVVISNGVTILCHKRDARNYKQGDKATQLPFIYGDVNLETGCQIGINTTILPGVTIGEGAIIGSCSLVTKDIPAWSIAVGSPAKVIRNVKESD